MAAVSVIMSTYNGSKFILQQIQSILEQKGVDVNLYIRDDGSTDNTIEVVRTIKDDRIHIMSDSCGNLGPGQSFLQLLKGIPDAEYYAYADQDDVWKPDKLLSAIEYLKKNSKPAVYCSVFDLVDEKLQVIQSNVGIIRDFSLRETLVYRGPLGCTVVFNSTIGKVIRNRIPEFTRMHDHWTILVAEVIDADIYIDKESHILYRQHGSNVVGVNSISIVKRIRRLLKSMKKDKFERYRQAVCLFETCKDIMTPQNKKIVEEFVNYKRSAKQKIILLKNTLPALVDKDIKILFLLSVLFGIF